MSHSLICAFAATTNLQLGSSPIGSRFARKLGSGKRMMDLKLTSLEALPAECAISVKEGLRGPAAETSRSPRTGSDLSLLDIEDRCAMLLADMTTPLGTQ